MSVYASDPNARPDDEFEPGTLRHLAPGARGRMLDPRRTPVSVVVARPTTGFVVIRIEDFEDEGAIWDIPLERVGHFQFEPDGPRVTDPDVAEMEAAIERLSGEQVIEAEQGDRERSETRIAEGQAGADRWLGRNSRFLAEGQTLPDPSSRRGDPHLASDLEAWLREQELWDIEDAFARTFVSNPGSGEIVKGHRIVLAELGLATYSGAIVRDPATFSDAWTKPRRAEHIITRLGFLRALLDRLGITQVSVWRGLSAEPPLRPRGERSFVSTTFDEAVARSHFESGADGSTRILMCRRIPVERLFMTYLETAAMNDRFLEAEAVLLDHPDDGWP